MSRTDDRLSPSFLAVKHLQQFHVKIQHSSRGFCAIARKLEPLQQSEIRMLHSVVTLNQVD